jgi:hypothetical protein
MHNKLEGSGYSSSSSSSSSSGSNINSRCYPKRIHNNSKSVFIVLFYQRKACQH